MTVDEIIEKLKLHANAETVSFKEKKYGIVSKNALGIFHKDLKEIAKEVPKDNELAIQLFDTNIYEARLLCSKIYNPKELTEGLMEKWVKTFENWEICDSFCMAVFARSKLGISKATEWSTRKKEFEKRAGFAVMAALCMADKKAENTTFEAFLPILEKESTDERIYVKKAISWALRNIGKRNIDLKDKAIETAQNISKIDNKASQWIAKDVLKELTKENLRNSDYPRHIYRPNT